MTIRDRLIALCVFAALGFNGCNSGAGTSPQAPPSSSGGELSQTATATYQLGSAAGAYSLPPLGGFRGALALPATTVPANTRLELTSSLQPPAGAPRLQDAASHPQNTGALNVYFYSTIRLSRTVT